MSTDPTAGEVPAERFPRVAGRCPSCPGTSLFLAAGGHVTCSRLDCPDPGAVDDQLHAEQGAVQEDCTGGHAIGCRHVEHPDAPLAEAGHLDVETARDMLLHPGGYGRSLLAVASEVVVTALDVRGRERDAARADRDVLSRLLRGMTRRLWKHRLAFRQIRRAGAAAEHRLGRERDAARAEVQRLRVFDDATRQQLADVLEQNQQLREELRQADEFGRGEFRVTQDAYDQAVRRIDELRAEAEAAKAVVQAWHVRIAPARTQRMEHLVRLFIGEVLADRLDALARVRREGER